MGYSRSPATISTGPGKLPQGNLAASGAQEGGLEDEEEINLEEVKSIPWASVSIVIWTLSCIKGESSACLDFRRGVVMELQQFSHIGSKLLAKANVPKA